MTGINKAAGFCEVTPQSPWSRYDRHFVSITRYNALSQTAKYYRVIQIKLNQFKKMSVRSLTYKQSVFKRYYKDERFSEFYLQDGDKNKLA